MPSTNTAGRLASRAGEMPSAAAVAVSIIATCCRVSFSYEVSGEAASRLTVWEAPADSASDPVKLVPCGSETGHQTPAAVTPLMRRAIASASAGKPMAGLASGGATSLAGPLCCTVTVVSSSTVNWCEIWPAPVAVMPSTATNAPTPRTVPSMVSAARPGRCTIPATASAAASRAASRGHGRPVADLSMTGPITTGPITTGPSMTGTDPLGQHPVADADGPPGVRRHARVVRDHHDGEAGRVQLVEQFHQR